MLQNTCPHNKPASMLISQLNLNSIPKKINALKPISALNANEKIYDNEMDNLEI